MSKRSDAVREAFRRGYRVRPNGEVSGSRVDVLRLDSTKSYPRFTIRIEGRQYAVPVHKLAAYQKYGEDALQKGVIVRHLDDNQWNNSPGNLAFGGALQNAMDVPLKKRVERAKHAASFRRVLSDEDELRMIEDRKYMGLSLKALSVKYDVSIGTAHNIIMKGSKSDN